LRAFFNFALLLVLAVKTWGETGSVTLDPSRFIVTPDQPVALKAKGHGAAVSLSGACRVTDYRGAAADNGGNDGCLKPGYYEIVPTASKEKFGIICLPAPAGPRDPFFCMDAALSWLQPSDPMREVAVRMMVRCGVGMVRERVGWAHVNASAGRFDWQGACRYQAVRDLYARSDLKILELFHDAPSWAGPTAQNPYPKDLIQTAHAWSEIGRSWGKYWGGIELWNEPDISFGGDLPADQYVAVAKALAHGLAGSAPDVPRGGGVFTGLEGEDFRSLCGRSGLLDVADFVSYHTYQAATTIEPQVEAYRNWLAAFGREGTPLWITECGWPWRSGTDCPSMEEDRSSAMEIAGKAVEAKACGIARYFAFVFPFYVEKEINYGMTARNGTPLRSLAAYAQCIRVLSNKTFRGDLRIDDTNVRRARVFGDDREWVAVLYAGQLADAMAKLPVPAERVEGIDGRSLEKDASGAIPIQDGLVYAFFKRPLPDSALRRDGRAMSLAAAARSKQPPRSQMSPVVIQHLTDLGRTTVSSHAYDSSLSDMVRHPLRLRVNNLSKERISAAVFLGRSGDKRVVEPVAGYTRDIDVDGLTSSEISFEVDLRKFGTAPRIDVSAVVRSKSGAVLDRLEIPFHLEEGLEALLQKHSRRVRLPIERIDGWQKNIVADARMEMSAEPGKPWRLAAHFGKGDPWVYPVFKLPADLSLERATGLVVRARCERAAAVRLVLREQGGALYFTASAIIPADGQWHAALVKFADLVPLLAGGTQDANGHLDLDQVHEIMLGMNSAVQENVLEVSDVHVVGPK
jgi:hypothetical protein